MSSVCEIAGDRVSLLVADEKQVLEFAAEAGYVLLENGAEISRVEETVTRICTYYGVHNEHLFVLSNGIFFSSDPDSPRPYAQVRHCPVKSPQLNRVIAVNQLSREIETGHCSLDEARCRLEAIKMLSPPSDGLQVLASGIGSACFCFLFGGDLWDSVASFWAGGLLCIFMLKVAFSHLSKIVGTVAGGIVLTLACLMCSGLGLGTHLDRMIVGAIIPLIPGVPFTNGVRDIARGDYISGPVRLLDAMLTFLCIAVGVGVALSACRQLGGVF